MEAGRSAWYWGAPLPDGEFNATVFVDPGKVRPADYLQLLMESRLLGPALKHAEVCTEIRVCDSTSFDDPSPVSATWIKVGDAALAIDPLSSQGVQTAIGTSLHAAAVLNTIIENPEDTGLAIGFYAARLAESASFHSQAVSRFYQEQYASCGETFWQKRADHFSAKIGLTRPSGRLAPNSILRLTPSLEFAPVAVVKGARVVRENGIKYGSKTAAYVEDGRLIAGLLRELVQPIAAVELVKRWSRNMPARQALKILNWTWAEGLILCDAPDWSEVRRDQVAKGMFVTTT